MYFRGLAWKSVEEYTFYMNDSRETKLRKKLAALAQKQRDALDRFQRLLESENASPGKIEQEQEKLARLDAERSRLISELRIVQFEAPQRFGGYGVSGGQRPMREQVLEILNEIGVPAAPRVVSDFADARCALVLPSARFASLRRDEAEAFKKNPNGRPAWIVPAINASSLTAIPRIIACSAWEPERRLIGSRTLRVNHLLTLLSLVQICERLREANEERIEQMDLMIKRFASSVIGAIEFGKSLDQARIQRAVKSELEHIVPLDSAEREKAVEKLLALPINAQLWGRTPLVLVEKGEVTGSSK